MGTQVSTFALSQQIITKFKNTQASMAGLQKQISTGLKSDTFAGYGSDTQRFQNASFSIDIYETYMNNISLTQNDLKFMNNSLSETEKQLSNVLSAIGVQVQKPKKEFDLATIQSVAGTALEIVKANVNKEIDGRYLFSGSLTSEKPYDNANAASAAVQNLSSDWLDGTLTQAQYTDAVAALTPSQLGYNGNLSSAGKILARADDNFEIDYTIKGDISGFKKAIAALNTLKEMAFPNPNKTPTPDVPTSDQFYDALNALTGQIETAVNDLRNQQKSLSSVAASLQQVSDQHRSDRDNALLVKEAISGVNLPEAIATFQTYQTQLEASFRTTSIMSELSLAKFIG